MKHSTITLKAGTRPSNLALTQSRHALDKIEGLFEYLRCESVQISSTGDADRITDLRESPPDFFTRELDTALLNGDIDLAVHSAKDLPIPMPNGIDWFWLPWREEPRDALVLAKGRTIAQLPEAPIVGVSSDRREAYTSERFPSAIQKPIRGNIEERIAQVDDGFFDVAIIAAAALIRLGLEDRINEWIELDQLEVPDGQGYLAVTFREGDPKMSALRHRFTKAVTFAGVGSSNTEETMRTLKRCDICIYSSLVDRALLKALPSNAQAIDVSTFGTLHTNEHTQTSKLVCEYTRRGQKVVYLTNDGPDFFQQITEATEALKELGIPIHVISNTKPLQPTAADNSCPASLGGLRGRRVLLTCSEAIQAKAADHVLDFGGNPVQLPLICLKTRNNTPLECAAVDWLLITSPSSVRSFMQIIEQQAADCSSIPRIMVCGRGTADELAKYGLHADAQPESDFSAKSLIELSKCTIKPGEKILRVRSDTAGPRLANELRNNGWFVDDIVIYDNVAILYDDLPEFDAVFFASASAVNSFIRQWGAPALIGKTIVVIGNPTKEALEKYQLQPNVVAREATVKGAVDSLAEHFIGEQLCILK